MSLRQEIITAMNLSHGLSGKVLYVDQKNGNDANSGLSITSAKKTIGAALTVANLDNNYYKIIVLGGVFNESLNIETNTIIGLFDATLDGGNVLTNGFDLDSGDAYLVGFIVKNFTNFAVCRGTSTQYNNRSAGIVDCEIEGNSHWARGYNISIANCTYKNSAWTYTGNGSTRGYFVTNVENCTFYNCNSLL